MNGNINEAILATKKIIDIYFQSIPCFDEQTFEGYQHVYFSTNEKIRNYLDIYNINNKESALTVASGGDHTLNLLSKNVLNIDTFDVNKLTEYVFLGIKFAMIRKYSYEQFLEVTGDLTSIYTHPTKINEIILDLIPYMDEKYRIFWKEIIDYDFKQRLKYPHKTNSLSQILFCGPQNIESIMYNNYYLLDINIYNNLKNNLGKANITFTIANARFLDETFKDKKYDLILLSNILGYFYTYWGANWSYNKLKDYLNKLKCICNDDSIIYFYYSFIYKRFHIDKSITKKSIINGSEITLNDYQDEELHRVFTEYGMINDAISLVRVNNNIEGDK